MEKKIEQTNALFLNVDDINSNMWVINKREVVSAVAAPVAPAITRIVLTSGAVIDTYLSIGYIRAWLSQIEHKNETEAKS